MISLILRETFAQICGKEFLQADKRQMWHKFYLTCAKKNHQNHLERKNGGAKKRRSWMGEKWALGEPYFSSTI